MSTRSFSGVFDSADECLVAAFDEGVARLSQILVGALASEQDYLEQVRAALSAVLGFLDDEPGWARLLVLEAPIGAVALAERRQRALAALAQALADETCAKTGGSGSSVAAPRLTAELVVGGVFSAVQGRMRERPEQKLADLAPSLMAFIATPYQGLDVALDSAPVGMASERAERDRSPVRVTYRTTRVLNAIGASPRLSNREIAESAGLNDQGQTSKLLRRLEQRGLVENVGLGQAYGEANAWLLTAYGERVRDATRRSLAPGAGAVAARRVRGAA